MGCSPPPLPRKRGGGRKTFTKIYVCSHPMSVYLMIFSPYKYVLILVVNVPNIFPLPSINQLLEGSLHIHTYHYYCTVQYFQSSFTFISYFIYCVYFVKSGGGGQGGFGFSPCEGEEQSERPLCTYQDIWPRSDTKYSDIRQQKSSL